jgi:hypothetical protein
LTFTRTCRRLGFEDVDVGLAEDDEQVALAGVLEVFGHVQVGVHAGLEHGDAAELVELGGVRVVVEGAGDEHVEIGIAGLAGGFHQVGAGTVPNSGPMKMAARFSPRLPSGSGLRRRPGSPGQGVSAVKLILSSLCACCTPAVLRFSRIIWTKSRSSP